ncbi:response regulator [Azospirillum sp. RWY-5-1]|uniref:Response regulator n=1 Tax=Azospirillum oleiclasticum TaxID=2735135 RepID=A0ABX2T363_9PROT|nr:response regulator [Azospirillum oleiclasticum]NYZ11118.1 response regulator [Azospirillum oleiclasticum]NYZ18280.1 response regulator [Azospirillum oleiclasticum]
MARILVVDDDITSLELAALVCEQDGHDVIRAEDGRVAMRDLRIHEVDLVLTDIMMPDIDGFSVVQLARQLQPGIKVIVVSAIGDRVPQDMTTMAFDKLGVDRVITKPYRPHMLIKAIRELLSGGSA